MREEFPENYTHTSNDYYQISRTVGLEVVDVHIRDTDDSILELETADAIIGVFSFASKRSFQLLQFFSSSLRGFQQSGRLVCLVGTHTDVKPQVNQKEALKMADDIGTELFPTCVKDSKQAMGPWNFLLNECIRPTIEQVIRTSDMPTQATTPTETIMSARDAWSYCLRSMGKCFGLRRAKSKVWFA